MAGFQLWSHGVRSHVEYEDLYKVHIEGFCTKQEVIAKDNWNTILKLLGDAGKTVRVAGSGRIVRKNERGRPQNGPGESGEEKQPEPTTKGGDTVSGAPGTPDVQSAMPKPPRKKRSKKKRRQSGKNGTESAPKSHEVAASATPDSSATEPTREAPAAGPGTVSEDKSQEGAFSSIQESAPVHAPSEEVDNEYVHISAETESKGPHTRAKASKANAKDSTTAVSDTDGPKTVIGNEDDSPIKRALGKIWSNRNK